MNILSLKNNISKLTVLSGFMFFTSLTLSAQVPAASTVKLAAEPTYTAENPGWLVNLDEAYAKSKATGKPIMANFTGSDWCGWCKKLTSSVFVHDAFKEWAEQNVILLEIDAPRRKYIPDNIKSQNAGLQQAFQVQGYPTVWVFNMDKDPKTSQYTIEALGKTGYTATVEEFTSSVDQMINK